MREGRAARCALRRPTSSPARRLCLMIGELNSSHSGANPPLGSTIAGYRPHRRPLRRAAYERRHAARQRINPASPARLCEDKPGDVPRAIDHPIAISIMRSINKTGKRTVITLAQTEFCAHDVNRCWPICRRRFESAHPTGAWVNANRD